MPSARNESAAIADHGVIGDLQTAALVASDGTIDFLCLPEFDSPTVFAQLLDFGRGGQFGIAPVDREVRGEQRYIRDTNVLVTRFLGSDLDLEVVDFMPIERAAMPSRVVRLIRMVRGNAKVRMNCAPRPDYARAVPAVTVDGRRATYDWRDGETFALTATVPLHLAGNEVVSEFELHSGQRAAFVFGPSAASEHGLPDVRVAKRAMRRTVVYWRRWIAGCDYRGEWRAAVRRSALTLKLLQSRRTGAIIAAPTFGLPEQIGGTRNWDFRYAWIRDASFTVYALVRLGLSREATAFTNWVTQRCADAANLGELQSFYGIDGRRHLVEHTLDHLAGHRDSRPVRIGNAAFDQLQLDIYGELMDAMYLADVHNEPMPRSLWKRVTELTEWVCRNWHRPDQGIWEVRSGCREFLYSRVMCWVALDRALRIANRRRFAAPRDEWRATREAIRQDIHAHFWNEELSAFVGEKGSRSIDAACLVMPLVGFISATDTRWRSTLRLVEARLVRDSLVRRYDIGGMDTDAGNLTAASFTICSFWYVECLARGGELERARVAMRKLVGHANDLGLYSEDIGADGTLLGNFPQGLTHAALVGAAAALYDARTAGSA